MFVLSFAIVMCIVCSSICTKSLKESKLVEKLKTSKSAVLSLAVLSFIATIYIIFLAGTAVGYWCHRGEDEIRDLFHNTKDDKFNSSNSISLGFVLTFDLSCLIFWYVIIVISACTYIKTGKDDDYIPILSLTVLSPVFCVIAHSPYIAIAYLDDGSHASSIFIYYSILFYALFGLLWLFFHWCENIENNINVTKLRSLTLIILFVVVFIFLGLVVTISCYFVLIPINKSISDAPNRVFSIYQSGGFVIGSVIVYKVFEFFFKKKTDTVTVEQIHKILQERLPHPLHQQFYQLQQQYDRLLQLELHPMQQNSDQLKNFQKQLYEHQLEDLRQTKQQLLQFGEQEHVQESTLPNETQQQNLHNLQKQLHELQQDFCKVVFPQPKSNSTESGPK